MPSSNPKNAVPTITLDRSRREVRQGPFVASLDRTPVLLDLLDVITSRPGVFVPQDILEDRVWHGSRVQWKSIRGTASRLRKVLSNAGLAAFADSIEASQHAVRCDWSEQIRRI